MLVPGLTLALMAAEPVAPSTAVLLVRRTAVPAGEATTLVRATTTALQALGLPQLLDPDETDLRLARLNLADALSCKARPACVAELARQLGVHWVVMVSLGQLGEERSVGLELLEPRTEAVLEREGVLLPAEASPRPGLFEAFAERVRPRLERPSSDTPVGLALTPPTPVAAPPPLAGAPGSAHPTSWALGGTGVAVLAAGAVLLGVGLTTRAGLQGREVDGRLRSDLSVAQAQRAASEASWLLGGAGACAAVGLALGTAAVLTW